MNSYETFLILYKVLKTPENIFPHLILAGAKNFRLHPNSDHSYLFYSTNLNTISKLNHPMLAAVDVNDIRCSHEFELQEVQTLRINEFPLIVRTVEIAATSIK